jgi:hypothetical protein
MTGKKNLASPEEAEPLNLDANVYGDFMDKHFRVAQGLGLTDAQSKEEFFGFDCSQVTGFYCHRQGYGSSFFFRLDDGAASST